MCKSNTLSSYLNRFDLIYLLRWWSWIERANKAWVETSVIWTHYIKKSLISWCCYTYIMCARFIAFYLNSYSYFKRKNWVTMLDAEIFSVTCLTSLLPIYSDRGTKKYWLLKYLYLPIFDFVSFPVSADFKR